MVAARARLSGRTKSFKDRLYYLVGDNKPYSWCKQAGIEKGLFQYYWQKGKIPKNDNLIKIRNFSGCSLDWLLTGEGEPYPDRIDDMISTTDTLLTHIDKQVDTLQKMVDRLKTIRKDVEHLRK